MAHVPSINYDFTPVYKCAMLIEMANLNAVIDKQLLLYQPIIVFFSPKN